MRSTLDSCNTFAPIRTGRKGRGRRRRVVGVVGKVDDQWCSSFRRRRRVRFGGG
jgi:hypothetical protein